MEKGQKSGPGKIECITGLIIKSGERIGGPQLTIIGETHLVPPTQPLPSTLIAFSWYFSRTSASARVKSRRQLAAFRIPLFAFPLLRREKAYDVIPEFSVYITIVPGELRNDDISGPVRPSVRPSVGLSPLLVSLSLSLSLSAMPSHVAPIY